VYLRHETDVWFEITTLLIPGENDSPGEIEEMSKWIADNLGTTVPLHFTAFHPDYRMKDKPPTPPATLTRAREIALANGIEYVYTGNVHDPAGGSTYCKSCGEILIGRDWYELSAWNLDPTGNCLSCGTPCDGVFDGPPGKWGRRRQPVMMSRGA
ncbi:MAG TPA: AmmeMemoRadiSam system radical SAM enzyme, partial [Thermoanaerobaculia bacterium]|nr:AmmeMemoRadiSam system radical SAM enzyme [Thermoanaerobaculia bacterium]